MNIDPSLYLSNKSTTAQQPSTTLGKDDFLKLLVAQLKNQDPTAPMDNKEFISQMASFTSLEQTKNMSDSIQQFVQSQSTNMLASQSSMIGKNITWSVNATDTSGNTTTSNQQGTIASVKLVNGSVNYVTTDGQDVSPSDLISVSQSSN